MKFKILLITFLSVFIGVYLGLIMFKSYKNTDVVINDNEASKIYFLQQGAYSTIESMHNNTKVISNYIYFKENNMYKVYLNITTDYNVATKIKDIYKERNVNIYIKEGNINNKSFVEKLKQYDQLIIKSESDELIFSIISQVLNEYKMVMESEQ